jgi:hypothetical protein
MDESTKQVIKERIKGYQEQRAQASKTVLALDGAIAALIELLENDAKEAAGGPVPAD